MDGERFCLYIAFLGALGAFFLLALSVPTEYMVEAKLVDSKGERVGTVNFGILRGSKSLDDGTGNMEVHKFIVNEEYGDVIHPLVQYVNILATSFGAISALIATILSLVNIIKTIPFSSPAGPMGLFFYNIIGAFLASITVIVFPSVVYATLDGDITGPSEKALGYSSTDLNLGYTFWLQMAGVAVLGLNCGMIIFSRTCNLSEEVEDLDGVPRLTRTIKMEEDL